MADRAKVLLSGFADECAISKQATEQLAVFSALGFQYYSLRFVDVGNGVKNVMKLDDAEIDRLLELQRRYDLHVATIGSPIGKVKLVDVEDGTRNQFIPFDQYLDRDVNRAIELAHRFETKLIRGFTFYPPRGDDVEKHFPQAIDQLSRIAERCEKAGVIYGLELEANLMGYDGASLARLHAGINSPAVVTIFDGGNLSSQNVPASECLAEYHKMADTIGWMHVKDYRIDPSLVWQGHVDEERLKNFVPCDEGDSEYEGVLRDFKSRLPALTKRMQSLGAPGVFLDLEPHLKGGGQFGGYSEPDGMGVALRALCRLLDRLDIDYDLRKFADLKRTGASHS